MGRKILGAVVVIALVIGFRTYSLNSAKKEVRQKMVSLCEDDQKCKEAVTKHFDPCWEKNTSMGGRNTGPKIDGEKLAECVNERSGEDYFSYSKEK